MARLVLILARSGTGKSTSLRNLKKGEAQAILCSGKELPFKTDMATFVPGNYGNLLMAIDKASTPVVILDDLNYMLSFEEMARANETGYVKFSQMAQNMFNVFKAVMEKEPVALKNAKGEPTGEVVEQIFYLLAHSAEPVEGDTQLRFKTTGKMLSEKIVLEGLTNVVIGADVIDGEFVFKVKTDGTGIKTPMGMFDTETVPNDLKAVDETIRSYYA